MADLIKTRRNLLHLFREVLLLTMLTFGVLSGIQAQSGKDIFPAKPEPAVYVHDYSGWLQPNQKAALENKLRRYWDSTSTQIVVMIRPDLGDYDRATYAIELGNRWGIGRKDKNNGVVMLIKSEAPDRGIFIATGYGAEGGLTDLQAGRIIRNTMGPFFKQQQYYQGIDAGLDEIITALTGEFQKEPDAADGSDLLFLLFVVIVIGLFVLFIFVKSRSSRKDGDWYTRKGGPDTPRHYRGNTGGGWWMGGGPGGWNSGGGSSGGGGFDGGSFGGGSFGGGGAGGDW